jgi:hypothetical protein
MNRFLPNTKSTCAAVLGLLVAAVSGCANETPISKDKTPAPKQQSSAITARDIGVSGCRATAIIDITSAEDIEFVAIDRSDIADLRTELSTIDEEGRETRINEELLEVDASFQSLLDSVSNNMNASELSRRAARELISRSSSSTTTESVDHSDSTAAHSDSSSFRDRQASASTDRVEQGDLDTENRAEDFSSAAVAANERESRSERGLGGFGTVGGLGGLGTVGGLAGGLGGLGGFAGSDVSSREAAATSRVVIANENSSFRIADRAAQSERQTDVLNESEDSASANRSSRTSVVTDRDALDRETEVLDQSARDEESETNRVARSEDQMRRERHMAMTNLDQLRSRHLVLRVEFTGDENHEMLRVFEGNRVAREAADRAVDRRIDAQGDITVRFNECGVGGVGGVGGIAR